MGDIAGAHSERRGPAMSSDVQKAAAAVVLLFGICIAVLAAIVIRLLRLQ